MSASKMTRLTRKHVIGAGRGLFRYWLIAVGRSKYSCIIITDDDLAWPVRIRSAVQLWLS